jgi:hypothetical protein
MTNEQSEFWSPGDFRQVKLDDAGRRALLDTYEKAARTLDAFDRANAPYGIDIELVEHHSHRSESLAAYCQLKIMSLAAPRKAIGRRRCKLNWVTQVHATMRLVDAGMGSRLTLRANPDLRVQPTGSLLVDIRQPVETPEGTAPLVWEESVQATLQQHPLARAGAEYVVAVDFPAPPAMPERARKFEKSLALIQQIEQFLPVAEDQRSVISEFWLNFPTSDDDAEPMARLRIWRLGVMQVAPTTRRA